MKKSKILALFPLLGLLLTGCDFKEVLANAKSWVSENIYHPVKDFIDGKTGEEDQKEDSGKTEEHVHSYDKDSMEWAWTELSSGGYSAKAVLECKGCGESEKGHFLELDATVTMSETLAPTCSTAGTMTYTATVTYDGKTYTATKDKSIYDTTAHHYIEAVGEAYLKSPATCTEDAVYYKSCEHCHELSEETFVASGSKLGHHLVHHDAASSTCQEHGNIEYYECDRCEKLFLEESAETEVTKEQVELPLAHNYVEVQAEEYLKSPATCTEDAVYYKSCEFCHEKSEETFTVENSKLGHHLIHHAASTSTCQEHGNIEYYECDRCEKLFLEESAATEVSKDDVELPLSHNLVEVIADEYLKSPATCTEDAVYYKSCEFCHEKGEETFAAPNTKLGHNLVHHAAKASTCHEHGNVEYYACERCGLFFADDQAAQALSEDELVLPLAAHDMSHHAAVEATCTENGSKEYYTCSYEDGVYYKDAEGTEKYNDASELVVQKLGHVFNDSLECVKGDTTMKAEYEMEDASAIDGIAPVTISDMGGTSGSYMKTGGEGHTFLNYNFLENGGADVWMKYRYSHADGNYDEAAAQWFVLNNHSEDGFRIRLDGRAENDGIAVAYVYSVMQYGNPGTDSDIPQGPSGSAMYFFPRPSQFKANTDIIVHFAITLVDPVKNVFNIKIEAGSNGTLYQLSKGAEAGDYSPRTFNIEMGESFTGWTNKSFRFTAKRSSDIMLSDAETLEKALVYKNAAGEVVGKINNAESVRAPELVADGKTFLGWFDVKGNRINDGDAVNAKKEIITPRFVETKANMFVPSNTIGENYKAAKGGWVDAVSTGFGGATSGQLPVTEIADGYDFYYIYRFVSRSASDNYAIFGIPYDFTDAKTRIEVRIDNPSDGRLAGYISGGATNLGNAGAAGTYFGQSGFRANGSDLLIHISVSDASAAGLAFVLEIVNLGSGARFETSRNVTFNDPTVYSLNNPLRNMFDCVKVNCEYRITDGF